MMITMTNSKNLCLSAIEEYLSKPPIIEFKSISKKDRNAWIQNVIMDYEYLKCCRSDKGMLRKNLAKTQKKLPIKKYENR
ncbi:MAG: hypothetical protein U9R06_02280 [Patescibacteria group bacterium]|nr:hypothetical protein [Patescibacteria group bacterium]